MDSYISDKAQLGRGTTSGHNTVICADVVTGEGCQIGHQVVIHPGVRIGSNVRIDDHTTIGKLPMRAANSIFPSSCDLAPTQIGDDCIIGTGAVIYAGCEIGQKVLIADMASVRENVSIGDFTIVGRGATVENYCTVGKYCKLETECYITAYSVLEDRAFVAPQVTTSNDNFVGRTRDRFKHFRGITVKRGGRVGAGSVVLPGKVIGEDALVAAGSVVTRDVPPRMIVMGCPARVWKEVPEEQLLENQGWDLG